MCGKVTEKYDMKEKQKYSHNSVVTKTYYYEILLESIGLNFQDFFHVSSKSDSKLLRYKLNKQDRHIERETQVQMKGIITRL